MQHYGAKIGAKVKKTGRREGNEGEERNQCLLFHGHITK